MKRYIRFFLLFLLLAQSLCLAKIAVPVSLSEIIPKKPAIPPASWFIFIGDYAGTGLDFTIREDNGRLQLLYRGIAYPLEIRSEDTCEISTANPLGERSLVFSDVREAAAHTCTLGKVSCRRIICVPRVTPARPIEELRKQALKAHPPVEKGDFFASDLVEVTALDPSIRLDIRYATSNNFMGTPMYEEARAFLQRPAAEALVRVSGRLRQYGYGLMIYDAYRPWYVTKMFWDATPDAKKDFVANPALGSVHNRGAAVDLVLYELNTGIAVDAGGEYDEFGERSYPDYKGGTARQRWYREVLRCAMGEEGFTVYPYEWWHFNYRDYARYPIMNAPFDRTGSGRE